MYCAIGLRPRERVMLTMRDQYATHLPTYRNCIPKGEEDRGRVRDGAAVVDTVVHGALRACR